MITYDALLKSTSNENQYCYVLSLFDVGDVSGAIYCLHMIDAVIVSSMCPLLVLL